MNVNEVIAHRANQLLEAKGSSARIHANDDVNKSQSSNDTFPTAMHMAGLVAIEEQVLPALQLLKATLKEKAKPIWISSKSVARICRTRLADAGPRIQWLGTHAGKIRKDD